MARNINICIWSFLPAGDHSLNQTWNTRIQ
ncbi:hypothetical protein ACHAXS_003965 [Conticribra weissflogii]